MDELSKHLCRVCLRNEASTKYLPLFENYVDKSLSEHIQSIATVSIREGDGLPDRMCPDCFILLDGALAFKRQCESSDKLLRGLELSQAIKCKYEDTSVNGDGEPEYGHQSDLSIEFTGADVKTETDNKYADTHLVSTSHLDTDVKPGTNYLNTECSGTHVNKKIVIKKSRSVFLNLICDDCGGSFKSKCKLRVHWKKVHLKEKLICPTCRLMFKCKAFKKHIKANNCSVAPEIRIEGQGKSRMFHCTYCSYKTNQKSYMSVHIAIHTGEKRFQCEICTKKFIQLSSLIAHKETHKEYKVQITCHVCGKHLLGRSLAYRHLRSHEIGRYQCKVCNKVVKYQSSLKSHMRRHTEDKPFKCEFCPTKFYYMSERRNHVNNVHTKDTSKYKYHCDMCEFVTYKKYVFEKHKMNHNGSNIPCLICGCWFDNAEKFARHKALHAENKYACEYCDKRYATNDSRRAHVLVKHKDKVSVNKVVHKEPNKIKLKTKLDNKKSNTGNSMRCVSI